MPICIKSSIMKCSYYLAYSMIKGLVLRHQRGLHKGCDSKRWEVGGSVVGQNGLCVL